MSTETQNEQLRQSDPLAWLRTLEGWSRLGIKNIEKAGGTGGFYAFVLEDGRNVDLGDAREVRNHSSVDAKLLDVCGTTIPKTKEWPQVVEAICRVGNESRNGGTQ